MLGRVPPDWREGFEVLREKVRRTTPEIAVPFGRQYVIDHLRSKRIRPEKVETIYDALMELAPAASRPTINISLDNLKRFIRENEYQTAWDVPAAPTGGWSWTFQRVYQTQRLQAERALGTLGLNPIYGALSSAEYGAREYGDAFIELRPEVIQERSLLVAGDTWRLVNPQNPAYVGLQSAPAIQYHPDWLPDARAAAALLWPPTACLRQGDSVAAAACILEGAGSYRRAGKGERSYTEFHLFGGLTLDDVQAFHVTTDRKAEELVRLLNKLGVPLPVYVVGSRGPYSPVIEDFPFNIGDRVVLVTGAVGRVRGIQRLDPEQEEFHGDGRRAYVELRELKGPSPVISGGRLYEDPMNVADIHILRVLRPRETYKLPLEALLMERNRKLMREQGERRGKEFRERYLRGLPPFESPASFAVWFQDLLESVPGDLGKWALRRIAEREFIVYDVEVMRQRHYYGEGAGMEQWIHDMEALGGIFGWYEKAYELDAETEPPMAGSSI